MGKKSNQDSFKLADVIAQAEKIKGSKLTFSGRQTPSSAPFNNVSYSISNQFIPTLLNV